ncbi:MAG: TRAP transporter small permease [Archangium sp.]|nr:TRAP transporter small permease [Archangium sp.]
MTASLGERVYRIERRFVSMAMVVMGSVVFLDVIHRVASRERGIVMRFVGEDKAWANPLGTALGLLLAVTLVQAALRLRGQPPGAKTWGRAALFTAIGYAALRLFLFVLPNGLVWSQTLGLVLMLWVGLVGASISAKEHRHLALDLGSKLWPAKVLPYVQAVGNFVTAAFCFFFAVLAVVSLRGHFNDYSDTGGAGGTFVALPIPKWAAFSVVPVAFLVMGVRFVAQGIDNLRGEVEEDDALHMLGLEEPKVDAANTAGGGDA